MATSPTSTTTGAAAAVTVTTPNTTTTTTNKIDRRDVESIRIYAGSDVCATSFIDREHDVSSKVNLSINELHLRLDDPSS